jgi:hypothetical protein
MNTKPLLCAFLLLHAGCSATRSLLGVPQAPAGEGPRAGASAPLDEILVGSWLKDDLKIAPPATDGEFLRRASLDLIGRVPTLPEARAFLTDTAPDRRARLVDRLLASPEYAEHFADVYSELLWRTEGPGARRIERQDPRSWLVTAFNENRPYDRLVWDLLTATGDVRDNGAVAFIAARARGGGGPEALAGASARLFLGLQIQCAQCHDHPYDNRWKQEDFYGLVGYFARTRVRRDASMMNPLEMGGMATPGPAGRSFVVFEQRRGEARMRAPRSESEVVIAPRFLGRKPAGQSDESRRETLARAVIESDLFPKAMVARTWAQLFGHAMIDPWDDLGAENDPRHPPLLVRLAADFRTGGYDIRALLRKMVLSPAYARSSARPEGVADDGGAAVRAFARARVRPLTSEQLFRTLLTATGADDMLRRRSRGEPPGSAGRGPSRGAWDPLRGPHTVDRAERQIERALREYRFTFDDDEMADADSFDGSMPQALLLLNGEVTNSGARAGEDGVLDGILRRTRNPAERLRDMFLAAYTRPPTVEEAAWMLPQLTEGARRQGRQAYEDAFFSLLISSESVTNH